MQNLFLICFLSLLTCSFSCKNQNAIAEKAVEQSSESQAKSKLQAPFDRLTLPEGFQIDYWAEDVENARAMSLSPSGTLYVGSRKKGQVYALRDTNGDNKADEQYILMKGLKLPTGVAYHDGSLYIAALDRILRLDDIENALQNPPEPVIVSDKFPTDEHHGWKYIAFGPDGKLYVPVGAPCNICEKTEKPIYASMTRMNKDGSDLEVIQHGIRNSVGFTWHPETKDLWFTDNGRDWMGDDMPACELNHAPEDNMHFGYPYCHQGDAPDPKFGKKRDCSEFTPPAQKLGAHVAPLGLGFYTGVMFPEKYKNQLIIAEHGSWNRSEKSGYQLSIVTLEGNKCIDYQPFISGWLDTDGEVWGRPVDVKLMPDGSMLVSDDKNDCIYRVWYEG